MSAREMLIAAVAEALRGALADVRVFDAPPVRATPPYAVVEEPVLADWSSKTFEGREGRIAVTLHDGGERPVRLRQLAAAAERAVASLDGADRDGWRLVTARLARSRMMRRGDDRWVATGEFQMRMVKGEA